MKTRNKALLLVLCAVILAAASVFGTMAYLTDTKATTNTFTVGTVNVKLDEAKVKANGEYEIGHDNRTNENTYHLIPGHTYKKDPTVTVLKGSEESYVRMMVEVNYSKELDAIFAPTGKDLTTIFDGYSADNWTLVSNKKDTNKNTRTYEFWYVGTEKQGSVKGTVAKAEKADIVLDDLFESITIPGEITKEQLATLITVDPTSGEITDQFKISVVAHAIQKDGFEDKNGNGTAADEAWEAFDKQN